MYERLYDLGRRLLEGLREVSSEMGVATRVEGPGPMVHLAFTDGEPIYDYRSFVEHSDMEACHRFVELLLDEGVRFISRGLCYLSTAHTEADVEFTLQAVKSALRKL